MIELSSLRTGWKIRSTPWFQAELGWRLKPLVSSGFLAALQLSPGTVLALFGRESPGGAATFVMRLNSEESCVSLRPRCSLRR